MGGVVTVGGKEPVGGEPAGARGDVAGVGQADESADMGAGEVLEGERGVAAAEGEMAARSQGRRNRERPKSPIWAGAEGEVNSGLR